MFMKHTQLTVAAKHKDANDFPRFDEYRYQTDRAVALMNELAQKKGGLAKFGMKRFNMCVFFSCHNDQMRRRVLIK